jgi:uncharacterized membrane protein (DUF2068 family)
VNQPAMPATQPATPAAQPATPSAPPATPATQRHRPLGLSILTVGATLIAVVLLLWAGVWLGIAHESSLSLLARNARLVALFLVIAGALQLVLAYGLWALRPWAWPFGIGLLVVSIALTLLGGGRGRPGAEIASLVLQIAALWYLLSAKVREALRAGD